jgi:hypothetical protein
MFVVFFPFFNRSALHLGWHGARLNFLALFLIALIRVKTVNLVEIATGFRNEVKTDSNYKRLQRFFGKFDLDYPSVAKLIVALMKIPQPWVLSIDRTQWSFGQTRFNIFILYQSEMKLSKIEGE